ncbi:MAG: DUF3798 domain-containing protein [Terrisporobacter othiniensis]|uniref:DUF3798 domain-containing protein n=1 Tax=Terrisporobacter petrolearius TaxID=1460447 RepID=UPI0022DFF656|nr:DUF3798 domain-containing protein [Terrisporobacter petrolearius]MDU4860248.1 DUF3798 domain-containing protein [Terrisporobacter othiniensis]MDU6996389.1 DUF3798 domain-containing protein [Terrisporobacter othiniensis]
MKKLLSILLSAVMMVTFLTGCTQSGGEKASKDEYHIAIVTPTLSTSEDEYRAGEEMAKKYPEIVKHLTLPENFEEEIETCISTIVSSADDPLMKAVIVSSGQSGLIPAFQQIKEKNPDILTISAPIFDEPEMMSKYIDLNLDTNWLERGRTIVEKANKMGAKTFVHYSFPTHLSKPLISARKDKMKETCEKLGMKFVEVVTPDPQTGDSVEAMQQFLQEDIPRQIDKYGKDTNIFGSNCPMYDVIIKEALNLKYMVAEQCCPTPTQAYPTVLGLEISEEDQTNFDKINEMISEKVDAAGMKGRLSGWPISVNVYMPQFAVEVAKEVIENDFDYKDATKLNELTKEKFGIEVDYTKLEDKGKTFDNYFVMLMESIFY